MMNFLRKFFPAHRDFNKVSKLLNKAKLILELQIEEEEEEHDRRKKRHLTNHLRSPKDSEHWHGQAYKSGR